MTQEHLDYLNYLWFWSGHLSRVSPDDKLQKAAWDLNTYLVAQISAGRSVTSSWPFLQECLCGREYIGANSLGKTCLLGKCCCGKKYLNIGAANQEKISWEPKDSGKNIAVSNKFERVDVTGAFQWECAPFGIGFEHAKLTDYHEHTEEFFFLPLHWVVYYCSREYEKEFWAEEIAPMLKEFRK